MWQINKEPVKEPEPFEMTPGFKPFKVLSVLCYAGPKKGTSNQSFYAVKDNVFK